jgi:hypothetical protein
VRWAGRRALPDLSAIAVADRGKVDAVNPHKRGRRARRPNRSRFQPEPIPAAVPTSTRGYVEAAPQPDRADQFTVWLHGDGNPDKPSSILLTREDVRRLCWFLHRLAESPQMAQGARLVSSPARAVMYKAAEPPGSQEFVPQQRGSPGQLDQKRLTSSGGLRL